LDESSELKARHCRKVHHHYHHQYAHNFIKTIITRNNTVINCIKTAPVSAGGGWIKFATSAAVLSDLIHTNIQQTQFGATLVSQGPLSSYAHLKTVLLSHTRVGCAPEE